MNSLFSRNLNRAYPLVDSASGSWMVDDKGNRYLDGCSGAVVANIGHGVEEVIEAIALQMRKAAFAHTSQFLSEAALELAEMLITSAPQSFQDGGRAYFVSGGSEAVETAVKMARGYFFEHKEYSRQLVISRWNSYHGATFGAMSVTGHPARRKPYLHLLKDQPHINPAFPYRCPCRQAVGQCHSEQCARQRADELESMILKLGPENVMAFIGEPVVGAALGAAVPGKEYWPRIRDICDKYGVLLIADEVMTGMGRTGNAFALNHWNVSADIIVAGKGLAAGYMPLAAVLASAQVVQAFQSGSGVFEHGFTYSGHPASCAAGVAVNRYMQKHKLVDRVAQYAPRLMQSLEGLRRHEIVGDVRGLGFLTALEFVRDRTTKEPFAAAEKVGQRISAEALAAGLLVYPGSGFVDGLLGDHVIVAPPFNIRDEELDLLVERLDAAISKVAKTLAPASLRS